MYFVQDPLSHFKRLEMGIFGFSQKDWSQECCHGNDIVGVTVSFVVYISGAKF